MGIRDKLKNIFRASQYETDEYLVSKACKVYLYYFTQTDKSIRAKVSAVRDIIAIENELMDISDAPENQPVSSNYCPMLCKAILYDGHAIIDDSYRNDLVKTYLEMYGERTDDERLLLKNGLGLSFINNFFDSKREFS